MKPDSFWFRPLSLRGWIAFVPILIFLGGMAWQEGLSAAGRYGRNPPAPLVLGTKFPAGAQRAGGSSPTSSSVPLGVAPDFRKLSALLVGGGELIRHHEQVFVDIAKAVGGATPIVALVSNEEERARCEAALRGAGIPEGQVHLLGYPLDSMWVRDYGPLFVQQSDRTWSIADLSYGGGEGKERWRDDECPIVMSEALHLPLSSLPIRMQGGNLLSNGEGLLLTSTSVLEQNLSRGLGAKKLAARFERELGMRSWLYLNPPQGETTQHVDLFVSLVAPNVAVVAKADPALDPANAAILDDAAERLAGLKTKSSVMSVHRIPLPPRGDGAFRSFNNIAIVNGVVLMPSFSDIDPALEAEALAVFGRLLPGRKIVPIRTDSMLRNGGLLRCVTLGIPKEVDWQQLFTWDPAAGE